ncbi:hypothetical protein [Caulobacter sp. 17J80-11]|uniref:hypothetical protein n=1 Tax=Caulobacter sp. 17J80-11 TaxID=2763502 RepID=UPI0016534860|nr:hypothetical protein [Caulobacter sp. 17J80-11]MBC6980893.1 hypothetical protein [Caulobacter sp. 17J80-11]
MKVTLLATAAAAVLFAAAPALAGEVVGHVDAGYSLQSWDFEDGDSADNTDLSLGGGFATAFGNGLVLQGDGQMNRYTWDGDEESSSFGYAAVHLATRNDQYAFGAFAGELGYYNNSGLMGGVEGQVFLERATLSGSLGYAQVDDWFADVKGWSAQAGAKYFVNDNFSVDAAVGYGDWDAWSEFNNWNASVTGEYKFAGSPASVYAGYRHDENSYEDDDGIAIDTFTIGLRLAFGAATLRDRDRHGASLDGAKAMADNFVHYY